MASRFDPSQRLNLKKRGKKKKIRFPIKIGKVASLKYCFIYKSWNMPKKVKVQQQ